MSTETITRKRLIYKEDISFDISGGDENVVIDGKNGTSFNASKINARHIPITKRNRAALNVSNVDDAIYLLVNGNALLSDVNGSGGNYSVATEITSGVARLATKSEVMAGVSIDTIVTPKNLHQLKATQTQLGLVEIASNDDLENQTRPNSVISASMLSRIGIASLPIGVGPIPWYWGEPPKGWLLCNGSLYSRSAYPDFWALIKNFCITDTDWSLNMTSFSSGDGSSTFRMPNLTATSMGGASGYKPLLIDVSFIFKGK